MRKSIIIIILVFTAIVLFVNKFIDVPKFTNPKDQLEFIIKEKQNERLDFIYLQLIAEDSLNLDYHYGFLINNPDIRLQVNSVRVNSILQIYNSYTLYPESKISDVGFYSLGLIASLKNDYIQALLYFGQVQNRSLKYLNNSIGRAYEEISDLEEAEKHYILAIESKGNLDGAYSNLIGMYLLQERYDDLYSLLKVKESQKYFPSQIKRYLYLIHVNLIGYFGSILGQTYQNQNLIGFLGALLVMLSWLIFLRKIDIYEPEKWRSILLIFILGMIFSELTFLLSDLITMFTGFNLNGGVLNDLMYCIIGIGVIEELVKIIPVLIILKYTNVINEPVDYLIYGSVSALGFAFAENLLYFNSYGPQIIMGRALTAVVFHMFLTSLAAYGLMLIKYESSKRILNPFMLYFLLAAIIHGLYDFWLINQHVSRFGILSIVILVFSLSFYNTLISNALSNSDFYDEHIHLNRKKIQNYLIYSLSSILVFQYIAISFKFGHHYGWESLKSSLLSGGYLIIFISANLGTINIKHREWKPLRIKFPKLTLKLDHNPDDIIGEKFSFTAISNNRNCKRLFPNHGIILNRVSVNEASDWYLVELENKKEILDFCGSHVLVKSRNPKNPISSEKSADVAVYVFLSDDKIDSLIKTKDDFLFIGWAKLK